MTSEMEKFSPERVNSYTVDQLVEYITGGQVTKEQVYMCGLAYQKHSELEERLRLIQDYIKNDEVAWNIALQKDTVSAYEQYLSEYDKKDSGYTGKYVADAKNKVYDLQKSAQGLYEDLFASMRREPQLYNSGVVKDLFYGADDSKLQALKATRQDGILSRFLLTGQRVSYSQLIEAKVIPAAIPEASLIAPDFNLVQTNISQLGEFPSEDRTDVYFIGLPRSGKSSVLSGILSSICRKGKGVYEPHFNGENKDLVQDYYYELIKSTAKGKYPVSTATDTISFMKLNLTYDKKETPLTFVEIGGEAFTKAFETKKGGAAAWEDLGAGSCLKSSNRKLLFFILDYNNNDIILQTAVLNNVLTILSTDGNGSSGDKGCTLSKVDTVAVLVTKSDLMSEDSSKRTSIANGYITENFLNFMNTLTSKCGKYGINRSANFRPYIMPFSLGRHYIGNTYLYDSQDSDTVVNFISQVAAGHSKSLFGRIFGNK